MDSTNAALSGIAGAAEGASEGLTTGIQNAVGIQQIQGLKQQNAVSEMNVKKMQAEETRLNQPVYKKDLMQRVPKEYQETFFAGIADKEQGKDSPDGSFYTQRDLQEHKEQLGNFDKHQMLNQGIDFLSKENEGLQKNLQDLGQKFQTAAQDLKYKVDKLRANHDNTKADQLLADAKKNMQDPETPEGQIYMPLMKAQEQLKQNQSKIGNYRATLNGAEESVKKIMEAHPNVDPNDLMIVWGGDKPNNEQEHQNYLDAKARISGAAGSGDKNQTEEQLTAKALKGDKESQGVLDAMQQRKVEIAKAMKSAQQTQGGTAFKDLEPDEKENAYKNFILNKVTPSFGMGANPDRKEWNAGLNKWMIANNVTPGDVATGRAAVKFQQATGTLQNKAILTTIDPLLDKLTQAGKELGNSSIPGWNYLKNTFKEATGQPQIVAFKNLRDDTIAEVERGLLNTGVLSDTKYIRAAKNVADSQSFPQLMAAVKNMRIVIRARLGAIADMSEPPSNLQSGTKNNNTGKKKSLSDY